jgi:transposase
MRGKDKKQQVLFTATTIESLVEKSLAPDHPLRRIKAKTDRVLASLSAEFDELYSTRGRPSVPPERVLRAQLWQALFSIRSERLLEDCLRFDLRCRWFVGLSIDEDAWDHSTFSKLRETVQLESIAALFFERHLEFLRAEELLSSEHLSVDGSLLSAWASQKSLVKKSDLDKGGKPPPPPEGGRNGWVDFKGEKRSNETHVSATDPDARIASKGGASRLCHELHVLAENRNNFVVGLTVTPPSGTSERDAALTLAREQCAEGRTPATLGGDRNYSAGDKLVEALASLCVVSHFAVRDDWKKALARVFHDDAGFALSIRKRMRIEEVFAFLKTICGLAKVKLRGSFRVYGACLIAASAYNLTRDAHLARA